MESELIGYVRKSKDNGHIKVQISAEAFNNAERYEAQDGTEFVSLVISTAKMFEILDGTRDVTSVCHIKGE